MQTPVVLGKLNSVLYSTDGKNTFTNLKTNVSGTLSDEEASKYFILPIEYNKLVFKYPQIIEMINVLQCDAIIETLGLKLEFNFENKTLKKV